MPKTRRNFPPSQEPRAARLSLPLVAAVLLICGCSRSGPKQWQGYLEGDFIYVASPLAGRLETLAVEKGSRVQKGAHLFGLEHAAESDALRQASQELKASRAQLEDLMKGSRPDEIAALVARQGQSEAAAELSRLDLARQTELFRAGAISASDFDRARLTHEANARSVDEDTARLETARLGGRADAVAAARAQVQAAADAEARAMWSVEQKAQAAPRDALVYDTLYREGEFVVAASPVVTLLPPGNIKVRFFVSEGDFGLIKAGDLVRVAIDGLPAPLEARVSYMSPQPEYTPPVLYNRDNRSKLVYMVEAVFAGNTASDLHPGEPVDVSLAAR
ncbi:MAG TPA: HlyD family efflux transporter periplasmic adaptor subunit [Opitutaceae bacterium]|nr:HlyD family efflux transporter periplasmic adaptor subunit [Opitutaceae bacterium]